MLTRASSASSMVPGIAGTATEIGQGAGENKNVAPYWKTYKDVTTKVVIKSGVISLGGAAFTRFDKVTSLVWDGDPTVTEINNNFLMCSSINELTIPPRFSRSAVMPSANIIIRALRRRRLPCRIRLLSVTTALSHIRIRTKS